MPSVELPHQAYPIEGIPIQEIEGWKEEAEKRMADQLARANLQYQEVDSILRTALHPRDEIIRVARALSADLLVISTHGYTGCPYFTKIFGLKGSLTLPFVA